MNEQERSAERQAIIDADIANSERREQLRRDQHAAAIRAVSTQVERTPEELAELHARLERLDRQRWGIDPDDV